MDNFSDVYNVTLLKMLLNYESKYIYLLKKDRSFLLDIHSDSVILIYVAFSRVNFIFLDTFSYDF